MIASQDQRHHQSPSELHSVVTATFDENDLETNGLVRTVATSDRTEVWIRCKGQPGLRRCGPAFALARGSTPPDGTTAQLLRNDTYGVREIVGRACRIATDRDDQADDALMELITT